MLSEKKSLDHIKNYPVTREFIDQIADARPSEALFAATFLRNFGQLFQLIYQPTGIDDDYAPSIADFEIPVEPPLSDLSALLVEATLHTDTTHVPRKRNQYQALERYRQTNPNKRHIEVTAGALTQPDKLAWVLLQTLTGSIKCYQAQKEINNMEVLLPEWPQDISPVQERRPNQLKLPVVDLFKQAAHRQIMDL